MSAASRCVNTGTQTIVFGTGTRLTIETNKKSTPSFFRLKDGDSSFCLAADFSSINATQDESRTRFNRTRFNSTSPARISGSYLFNQVALMAGGEECGGGTDTDCEDSLEPDTTVNSVSLVLLGLRLLFLKTIVFNVLMTLKMWISQ
ncbi:M1-specific T cell receptor alpha chain-like [Clinocottus analis]|uniref:M1-specific T cell receptor alpha chain-like n=1 Tax=Clinocottus analis TaxID=304258 RepID=UPI0035C052A3